MGELVVAACRGVAAGDTRAAARLLAGFGGMGSLSDLMFHPVNKNVGSMDDARPLNHKLRGLLDDVYRLAASIAEKIE